MLARITSPEMNLSLGAIAPECRMFDAAKLSRVQNCDAPVVLLHADPD
jgi:hypothetical protein